MININIELEVPMKIYFYRYGSICEPDVIDSFKRLGLDVDEETIEISKKIYCQTNVYQLFLLN